MVVIVVESCFPPGKSSEAGKAWIEVVKKYPPDRTISKQLFIGVRSSKSGMKTIGAWDVKSGKLEEALIRMNEALLMYTNIEGYRYSIKTYMSGVEAMPLIGLKAPED